MSSVAYAFTIITHFALCVHTGLLVLAFGDAAKSWKGKIQLDTGSGGSFVNHLYLAVQVGDTVFCVVYVPYNKSGWLVTLCTCIVTVLEGNAHHPSRHRLFPYLNHLLASGW